MPYNGLVCSFWSKIRRFRIFFNCNNFSTDKNPVFHEGAYGILVATLMIMDIQLNISQNTKRGWQIFWLGFFMYALGFILWNIDNEMCQSLRKIRSQLHPGVKIRKLKVDFMTSGTWRWVRQ